MWTVCACSPGYPEGKYGSGEDPRGERHQTKEPVCQFLADERSGGCSGLESPNSCHDETGRTNTKPQNLPVPPCFCFSVVADATCLQVTKSMAGVVKSMDDALRSMNLEKVAWRGRPHVLSKSQRNVILEPIFLQITALMDKFEHQFETLDVQTAQMEDTMSNTTTLTTPQVYLYTFCTVFCSW